MIQLTDEDKAAISGTQVAWTNSAWSTDGTNGMRVLLEVMYLSGVRAGIERAAKVADDWRDGEDAATAIRALLQ